MPYLVADDLPTESAGVRFRALLRRPEILQLPGAHNGMAALQAKAVGFEALYLSGAAMSASMGLPDLGIITVDDVSFFVRQAYFLGANDPYKALKTTLKAEIDEEAWASLYGDTSRPFDKPRSGRIAVKVINHYGDEVLQVYDV